MQQFDRYREPAEGENMPITQDGIPSVMARNGGVAMKHGGALSVAAQHVQAAGSGKDKILVHINPDEYRELIRKHGPVTYNEETGLPQLGFFSTLGSILKTVAPIAVSLIPGIGPITGAALGAGIGAVTSGGKLSGILSGAAMGGLGGGINALGVAQGATPLGGFSGWNKLFENGIGSAFSKVGDLATTGLLGKAGATGVSGILSQATSPLALGLLGAAANPQTSESGASGATWPKFPWQTGSGGQASAGPNIVAPTLSNWQPQSLASPSIQKASFIQTPSGEILEVPAQAGTKLPNYAMMQNPYVQAPMAGVKPVYARTGGLAQVKKYADGGGPVMVPLSAQELQAQGMDWEHFGEKPRPAGLQSFFRQATPVATPVTPTTPTTPTTTQPGTVNIDTSKYWDPVTGKYMGGWPGIDQYLKDQGIDKTQIKQAPPVTQSDWDKINANYGTAYQNAISAGMTPEQWIASPEFSNWQNTVLGAVSNTYDPNKLQGDISTLSGMVNDPLYGQNYQKIIAAEQARLNALGYGNNNEFKKGGALSRYVKGEGDGQADKIPAMLSDGEYVMDAETVSAIGNGSSEAGAKKLDEFRMNLRKHKRSAPLGKIPPKTKNLNSYMSGGSR